MTALMQQAASVPWWGIIVPATIFIIAFAVTWLLYRHFAGQR